MVRKISPPHHWAGSRNTWWPVNTTKSKMRGDVILVKHGPPSRATTKPDGWAMSVSLADSPNSPLNGSVHIAPELFSARAIIDHLTLSAPRGYKGIIFGPLGIVTSGGTLTPTLRRAFRRFPPFGSGAVVLKYCSILSRHSPLLDKTGILLAVGAIGPSMCFAPDWDKERMRDSLCNLSYYAFRGFYFLFGALW